ncbi:MAG: glycosyltransferase [Nitrospinota bacterium]|nr:glycosyltransferase [Nitrospinota bacterium]
MFILLGTNWGRGNTGDFTFNAIKRAGHKVLLITPSECEYEECLTVQEDIDIQSLVGGMPEKPDIFLHVDCSGSTWFFPENIDKLEIPTAFWSTDTHFNFRWHKEWAGLFDYTFFTQKDWMEICVKAGVDNTELLPYAADELFHRDFKLERDIDVGYVGSLNKEKRRYFKMMEDKGIKVTTNDRHLFNEEIGKFYSRCKIVYNISARYDMNQRTFEAPAAGALLIGQSMIDSGFYDIFSPGKNADVHDFDNAADIIRKYLGKPELLSTVAKAGQKLVVEGHTYRSRIEKIVSACSNGVSARRTDPSRYYLRQLKAALVYQHPSFRIYGKAWNNFRNAIEANPAGTGLYILKYLYFRIYEKLLKLKQKMGKAPY